MPRSATILAVFDDSSPKINLSPLYYNGDKFTKHKRVVTVYFLGYIVWGKVSTLWGLVENRCPLLWVQFTAMT